MRYYKKAIKKYIAERKLHYARELRYDKMRFIAKINAMCAKGKCVGTDCRYCPIRIANDYGDPAAKGIHCGKLDSEVVKKLVNKRVREK